MKLNRKTMMILGGVFLILFIFLGYRLLMGRKASVNNNKQAASLDGVIPTIDGSVKISLTAITRKKEVLI